MHLKSSQEQRLAALFFKMSVREAQLTQICPGNIADEFCFKTYIILGQLFWCSFFFLEDHVAKYTFACLKLKLYSLLKNILNTKVQIRTADLG